MNLAWLSGLVHRHRSLEDHVDRRALPQLHFAAARQKDVGQPHRAPGASSDSGSLPAPVGDSSDRGSRARNLGHSLGIDAFAPALLDSAFLGFDLLIRTVGID